MKPFLNDDFLLQTSTAKRLYHSFARQMPIFDYHCHLPVREIAEDINFTNMTHIWLDGDHYKWRAMRANGIPEKFITGNADDYEKFAAWAATVPKTLRNPLYHWAHMELKHPFGITDKLLSPRTAAKIYETCNGMLQTEEFSTRNLLKQMNVKVVCTTDDPVDTLEHHTKIREDLTFDIKVLPCFRPDKAMAIEEPEAFNIWVEQLEAVTDIDIDNFTSFIEAIEKRHDFFHSCGCRLSDHGLKYPYAEDYRDGEVKLSFELLRLGKPLNRIKLLKFKSAMLVHFARMDAQKGWAQQYHLGALRNNNTLALRHIGPDSGYDSIGDYEIAQPLARLLDTLSMKNILPKTILYCLNPRDNELMATMIGNFQDGKIPGKMQFGSGWWFNDQKDGIERQINALSNMGLLSRFVGMLTDSRSFLSYSRHEYFRRVLCNLIGNDVENGELPADFDLLGEMIQDICYNNAVEYFDM
ncbi:MAG: glucuronate isomerase [Desulfobacteraceae bacterium]|jgi:glucuronate isomerase